MRLVRPLIAVLTVVFVVLGVLPAVVSAHTGPNFDRSQTYWFWPCSDGTWGGPPPHAQYYYGVPVAESKTNGPTGRLEVYATTQVFEIGYEEVSEVGYIWKTVTCQQTGAYKTTIWGDYDFHLGAALFAASHFRLEYQIENVGTGQVIKSTQIAYQEQVGLGDHDYQGTFNYPLGISLIWDAVSGTTYHLRVKATAYAFGCVLGIAYSDGWGLEGVWVDEICISPYSSGGGGGGCVDGETMILMSDGSQKPAKNIRVGDEILSFNPETSQFTTETVVSSTKSRAGTVESFNGGLLVTTLHDQPIWVRHEGNEGWAINPLDVCIGWQIYYPVTGVWVDITETSFIDGNTNVYDIHATGPDTFIGNGVLLDAKIP